MQIIQALEQNPAGLGRLIPLKRPRIVRDLMGLSPVLARSGSLELRLATTKRDIRQGQRLRYQTFYVEGDALPSARDAASQRDRCRFDKLCDHLLVFDLEAEARAERRAVVGTYRLLRGDVAARHGGFYSQTEFDLEPMLERHGDKRFLELGRSCVRADYRSKRVIELLWRGIAAYAQHHAIDVLIGCASLSGHDPDSLQEPLSYLYHHAAADRCWQAAPQAGRSVRMDWIGRDGLDVRRAMQQLPPLVKAYVRAGGRVSSQAVADRQFGTIDLFTALPFKAAEPRYLARFGAAETRRAPSPSPHH